MRNENLANYKVYKMLRSVAELNIFAESKEEEKDEEKQAEPISSLDANRESVACYCDFV
jgi:hypothetical protein